MDTILTFIGGFLEKAAGGGSLGWALFLFTLIVTVFMLIPIVSEIRSLQLADKIRPLHEGILNKFQNKPDQMAKELMGMHKTFGYNTFLGIFSHLIHGVVFAVLAGTFFQADRFLPAFPEGTRGFLWIRDLAASPFSLLREGEIFPEFVLAVGSILLMDCLMSWNARVIIKKSLMPVDTLYRCLTWAAVAAAFFTPQAVLVYLMLFYLLKNVILVAFVRFFPYSMNQAQEAFYKKCAKNIKLTTISKDS